MTRALLMLAQAVGWRRGEFPLMPLAEPAIGRPEAPRPDGDRLFPRWFVRAARLLHGHDWVRPMARDTGLNLRTIQRLAVAERDGRDFWLARATMDQVWKLLDQYADEIDQACDDLDAFLG